MSVWNTRVNCAIKLEEKKSPTKPCAPKKAAFSRAVSVCIVKHMTERLTWPITCSMPVTFIRRFKLAIGRSGYTNESTPTIKRLAYKLTLLTPRYGREKAL